MEHLKAAIKQVQPSEIESYQELKEKFERLVLSSAKTDDFAGSAMLKKIILEVFLVSVSWFVDIFIF